MRDKVGFQITARTADEVEGTTLSLTKPACWIWDPTVETNLTFDIDADSGKATSRVTGLDTDTVTSTWGQQPNGLVKTQTFYAIPSSSCADGSTWTPKLVVTDASGTHTQTLDTVTVKSKVSADISLAAVGVPKIEGSSYFGSPEFGPGGNGPGLSQCWDIKLQPETLSKVGYADPEGNATFTVAFSGPRSRFELPRGIVQGCWEYVSPNSYNNDQFYPSSSAQTVTITMKTSAKCLGLLGSQANTLRVYSYTPQKVLADDYQCHATLTATVAIGSWKDSSGRAITDIDPTNNTDDVNLECADPSYGLSHGGAYFAPLQPDFDFAVAYPWQNTGKPVIRAAAQDEWEVLSDDVENVGYVGRKGAFASESVLSPEHPVLTNATGYQFWDPSKHHIDLAHLDRAVMGLVAPSQSQARGNPDLDTRALDPSTYTLKCTTDYTAADGANIADKLASLSWVDCSGLAGDKISGVQFLRQGEFTGEAFGKNFPNSRILFTQVPMVAAGTVGDQLTTYSVWTFNELKDGHTSPDKVTAEIVGNVLRIKDTVAVEPQDASNGSGTPSPSSSPISDPNSNVPQVQPEGTLDYTITPEVGPGSGTFAPFVVEGLTITNTIDRGVKTLDFSGLNPFWKYEVKSANLGTDGVPYTADDVSGYVVTFTPAQQIQTNTKLPPITYKATLGVLMPPQGKPFNATITNDAKITAIDADPDVPPGVRPKRHSAAAPANATTPELVFLRKHLVSEPVIEVEDKRTAWQFEWVNYNNQDMGEGNFYDVFPYSGDAPRNKAGEGSTFSGTSKLKSITLTGATTSDTTVWLTTNGAAAVKQNPAKATWTKVDPKDPSKWPENPTAIRVTVSQIKRSVEGYGAVVLEFEVAGQVADDIYYNDATGSVFNTLSNKVQPLGPAEADPVRVVASSISGVAWIDANKDGIRQATETERAPDIPVRLYRDGDTRKPWRETTTGTDGSYLFDNLHSSDYQVVFDVPGAGDKYKDYTVTLQSQGTDRTVDSDADPTTGKVAQLALAKDSGVFNLDLGLYGVPVPTTTPWATLTPGVTSTPWATLTPATTPVTTPWATLTPGVTTSTTPWASLTPATTPVTTPWASLTPGVTTSTTPWASLTPGVTTSTTPWASLTPATTPVTTPWASLTPPTTPVTTPWATLTPAVTTSASPTGSSSPDNPDTLPDTGGDGVARTGLLLLVAVTAAGVVVNRRRR